MEEMARCGWGGLTWMSLPKWVGEPDWVQVGADEMAPVAVRGGDNWMKRRWKSGQGRWWSWFLILLINDAAFPEDGAKWKYWQLHTKTSSRRATAMLILLTIIMPFPCLVRWSTESCWWPGCCSHQDYLDILRCNQESCTRLYKITCLLKITPRQRGFGHFVNSTSPWLTRKKCWFLHLNFQGIICLWADIMRCVALRAWGLQLSSLDRTCIGMRVSFTNSLNMVIGEGQQRVRHLSPLTAVFSFLS